MNIISQLTFGTALLTASLLSPARARADMLEGLGHWSGNGSVLSASGKPIDAFRVELTRSAAGPNRVETRGTVTTAQGRSVPFRSSVTRTADGLVTESERGTGYASCVEPNVCHSYEVDDNGNGTTSTVLVDGARRLRILVTELEKGKPVRLIWQTLTQP